MKNKFLITGATGFVGSCVARTLVERGEYVSIIARSKKLNWRLHSIADKLDINVCDLEDPSLVKIINYVKPSVVFHIAAAGALPTNQNNINQLIDTNIKGTANLINAVKSHNIKIFVNTGSSSEYGIKNTPMRESDILEPINDYGVTKSASTLLCQKASITDGLPIITLRLFSPFGYFDDKSRLISYVIYAALKNKPIHLSSPDNVRDFIFIEDTVNAYLKASTVKIKPGEIINIGSGTQHSVKKMVKSIIELTNSKSTIHWDSMQKQQRQIEPKVWQADISKAKNILDWKPENNLSQGLEQTIDWFRKNIKFYE